MTTGLDFDATLSLIWAQLWQVTLAALAVGIAARLAGRRRPRLAYTLWMLVILKALMPPVVSSPTGVFSWAMARREAGAVGERPIPAAPPVVLRGSEAIDTRLTGVEGPRPAGDAAWSIARVEEKIPIVLGLIWLTGLAVGVTFLALTRIACGRRIRRTSRAADPDLRDRLEGLARRLGVTRPVGLLVSDGPLGPAVFGVPRPTVLIPAPLLRGLDPDRLELILAHELIHIRRGDVLAGHLQLLVQLLWWFHPLVWWAGREASRLRELCCDEEVVSALGCPPSRYARGLLEVLDRKRQLRPLFSFPGMRPIEINAHRLEHIMRYRDDHRRRTALVCRLAFALGALLIIPGAGLVRQEGSGPPVKDREETAAGAIETQRTTEAKSPTKRLAESDNDRLELQIAEDRLKWAEDMHRKGYVSDAQVASERLKVESVKIRQAEGRVKWAERMRRKGYVSDAQVDRERRALRRLEISRAEIDLALAKDRLDWAEKMFAKGYVSKAQLDSERLGYGRANSRREALAAAATVTLRGVVRDKKTRRPLAGIQVSVSAPDSFQQSTTSDDAGGFTFSDVPARGPLILTGLSTGGEPYLNTSRVLDIGKDKVPSGDLELFRGIPFRVKVLDATTGNPIRGRLRYFPVYPNDPRKWGFPGYVPAPGTMGALSDAVPDGNDWYRGAVLPGPGVLCFVATEGERVWKKGERETAMFFPDGLDVVEIRRSAEGEPFALLSSTWDGMPDKVIQMLGCFPAVFAINPKEATREIVHEIRINPR